MYSTCTVVFSSLKWRLEENLTLGPVMFKQISLYNLFKIVCDAEERFDNIKYYHHYYQYSELLLYDWAEANTLEIDSTFCYI